MVLVYFAIYFTFLLIYLIKGKTYLQKDLSEHLINIKPKDKNNEKFININIDKININNELKVKKNKKHKKR